MLITTDTIAQKLRLHKQLVCTSAYDYTSACAVRSAGCIDILFVLAEEVAQCAFGHESAAALSLEVWPPRPGRGGFLQAKRWGSAE